MAAVAATASAVYVTPARTMRCYNFGHNVSYSFCCIFVVAVVGSFTMDFTAAAAAASAAAAAVARLPLPECRRGFGGCVYGYN